MTSQMQQVAESGAGVVQIVGNDAFCIAALQGLNAVGYEGQITTISQCITDVTREAIPGDQLEGISITATMALGATDDSAYQLYQAVMGTYGTEVDRRRQRPHHGRLHHDGVARRRPRRDLGRHHHGDGRRGDQVDGRGRLPRRRRPHVPVRRVGVPARQPAICSNNSLRASLDAEGDPASYEPVDSTEILEGL